MVLSGDLQRFAEARMDWEVTRPPESLWQYVRQLREDAESTLFHDILVYCRDGPLPWNRLCLALSFPAFQVVALNTREN